VVGIIDVQFSRAGAKALIKKSMIQFFVGSFAILSLMGIGLFMMFYYKVIMPINSLTDSIESISTKSFEFEFLEREDEIGNLAKAVDGFLAKVKGELELFEQSSEKATVSEKNWWKTILDITVSKKGKAIVVDENNMVMFTNFKALKESSKVHLLDIFDNTNSDIIQLVGKALESTGKVFEIETEYKGNGFAVKVARMETAKNLSRILIILTPKG